MEETLFAHVPIGILVVAPTGVVKAANPAAAALFGYAPDELVGLDVDALVPSRHREAHVAHRAAYAEAPVARRMGGERVLTALRKDGSERAVEVGLAPAPDGPDVYVTLLDVSAREDVSQALIDAQKINKAGTWSYDPVSGVVRWTPELFRIFRLPVAAQAPPYERHHELFAAESWARLQPAVARAVEDGTPYEIELELSVNDEEGPLLAVARCEPQRDSEGKVVRLVGTFQDVTELARAQRERDRALQRLALAQKAAKLAVWEWDMESDALVWDDRMYELYGVPKRPVTYRDWREAVHPEDLDAAEAHLRQVVTGGGFFQQEFRIRYPGGERHLLAAASIHGGEMNGGQRMIGINMDVSELATFRETLRQREAQLRRHREQWDRFFAATSNMLWNWDFATDVVERNVAFQTTLGYAEGEVVPTIGWWLERVHPDDRARVMSTFEAALERGAETAGYTYRIRRRDETYATIRDRVFFMRDESGRAYRALGAMTDITEELRREEETRRANNLESLGLLAGGIAHDFNNQLTAILSLAELLAMDPNDPDQTRELAHSIGDAVESASHLTRQLLTFSRGGAPSPKAVDLEELVRKHATFALTGSSTSISFVFENDLWSAKVDPGQVGQVIHNLVLNADQAMERGGEIRIEARNVARGDDGSAKDERFLELRVTDSGPGMPEDVLRRVFDPYFSTKTAGHGLGLSICHSIVERHGGSIRAESTVGEGTTFVVRLPATEGAPRESDGPKELARGSARVLVVDDLPRVRDSLRRLSQALGYRVDAVASVDEAESAMDVARKANEPYAAVITDLTIPGTGGGVEVLRRVKEADPDVRVVVASGYANDPVLADPKAHGFDGKLSKPVRLRELSGVLAAALAPRES